MNGLKPGFFKWWNAPPVVALDVTNPAAVDLIKYHGTTEDVGYGVLKNLTLDQRVDSCADDTIIAAAAVAAGSGDGAQLQGGVSVVNFTPQS